jgi:hypothetical protein
MMFPTPCSLLEVAFSVLMQLKLAMMLEKTQALVVSLTMNLTSRLFKLRKRHSLLLSLKYLQLAETKCSIWRMMTTALVVLLLAKQEVLVVAVRRKLLMPYSAVEMKTLVSNLSRKKEKLSLNRKYTEVIL